MVVSPDNKTVYGWDGDYPIRRDCAPRCALRALDIGSDGSTAYAIGEPGFIDVPRRWPDWPGVVFPFAIATSTVGAPLASTSSPLGIHQIALNATGLFQFIDDGPWGRVLDRDLSSQGSTRTVLGFEGDFLFPMGIVLGPSPAASFTVKAAATGADTTFDAIASHNDSGSIASYAWDVGDGTTATVSHRYAAPGTYTVTLTTTNDGGCATRFVYTGQSVTCTGSPSASTSRTVTIVTPAGRRDRPRHAAGQLRHRPDVQDRHDGGTLRLRAKTLRLRGKSVRVALRCQSSVACRGTLKLTSGKRTCATGRFRPTAHQRARKRLTVRSTCRKTRRGRLTSTVTTGQKTFAAAVRVKR